METDRRYTKININGFENTLFTSFAINTHRGWVHLDLEPSKGFYKLLARGFKPTSHAKIKLDRRSRRVIFHLSLEKEVEIYKPERIIKSVDVNENSVATLYEAFAVILETDLAETTLGYSYRKKSIQRRNGSDSRETRKAMEKLKEGKKRDYRWKTANMIVRDALRTRGVIVIERTSGDNIRVRYRNKQLRHRYIRVL
jgi:putative transposase